MATGFEKLANFDDVFETATAKPKYASEQSKAVPDGDYECECKAGTMKETSSGEVFTFLTTIVSEGPYKGYALERTIFFNKKDGTDEEKLQYTIARFGELKKDLATIGFDSANWTKANGRPFSLALPAACELLKGLRVKMKKKTGDRGANVYLNDRVLDAAKVPVDGKPLKFGAAELAAVKVVSPTSAPPAQSYGPDPLGTAPNGDPIPF